MRPVVCITTDLRSRNDNRRLYFLSEISPAIPTAFLDDVQNANMKEEKLRQENWVPCQPGTIEVAAKLSPSPRRKLFTLLAAGAVIASVGGGTALFSNPNGGHSREFFPAGIACIHVHENLASYVAGKMEDRDLKKRMTLHLLKCEGCRKKYEGYCCSSDSQRGSRPSKATLKPCLRNCENP